jgi:hypothetical protein
MSAPLCGGCCQPVLTALHACSGCSRGGSQHCHMWYCEVSVVAGCSHMTVEGAQGIPSTSSDLCECNSCPCCGHVMRVPCAPGTMPGSVDWQVPAAAAVVAADSVALSQCCQPFPATHRPQRDLQLVRTLLVRGLLVSKSWSCGGAAQPAFGAAVAAAVVIGNGCKVPFQPLRQCTCLPLHGP